MGGEGVVGNGSEHQRVSADGMLPALVPLFLRSTLYLKTTIWSTEQLSVKLFMQKEIEELAGPQEQLLEVHGWLGPDARVGGSNPGRSSEGAAEDVDGRMARRDKANGFYV